MELNKLLLKSRNTSKYLEDAIKQDITNIANVLLQEFDIYPRGTHVNACKETVKEISLITKQQLREFITSHFQIQQTGMCCAVTKSGTKCTRKSVDNSTYCKIHIVNTFFNNKQTLNQPLIIKHDDVEFINQNQQPSNLNDSSVTNNHLQKRFIQDTLYLYDSEYLYDIDTYEKVGYIDKHADPNSDAQFVLTDDPFELNVM